MKRFMVSLFTFVMLLMCMNVALADIQFAVEDKDFTIRGGIHFGATKDEIANIEKTNGNTANDDSDTYYGVNAYDLSYSTLLAGYESVITYWLDGEQKLDEFQYILFNNDAYSSVKNALTEKYGGPLFIEQSYITGTGIDKMAKKLSLLSPVDRDYAGWILKYNDCYVMLEMKHLYFTAGGGMPVYLVNYNILSYEEMDLYQAVLDEVAEYVNSSFENDL